MALQTNQLYSESSRGPRKRIQPGDGPGAVAVRLFKTGSGTLPVGTACYIEAASGFLVKIDGTAVPGATNAVAAIVWPTDVVLNGSGEVHGTVMMRGSIHYDELEALRAADVFGANASATSQKLKDICRETGVRTRGLVIEGLTLTGGTTGLS